MAYLEGVLKLSKWRHFQPIYGHFRSFFPPSPFETNLAPLLPPTENGLATLLNSPPQSSYVTSTSRLIGPPEWWQKIIKHILCDLFIFTLDQIIVLNKYCTYNKPIPKILHVKTLQNLCKMRYKKKLNKKVRNKLLISTFIF